MPLFIFLPIFLYPLKTSENHSYSDVSSGYLERDQWHEMDQSTIICADHVQIYR